MVVFCRIFYIKIWRTGKQNQKAKERKAERKSDEPGILLVWSTGRIQVGFWIHAVNFVTILIFCPY